MQSKEPATSAADRALDHVLLFRLFDEPLVAVGIDPAPTDTGDLVTALADYSRRSESDDFASLVGFLESHPSSAWEGSLRTELARELYNAGYYSKALDMWGRAWRSVAGSTRGRDKAVGDRAAGELAYMLARLGQFVELEALLDSFGGRVFAGPAQEKVAGAREGLWHMQNRPEVAFRCGPLALYAVKRELDPENPGTDIILASASTQQGFSLLQLEELSANLGLDFRMALREADTDIVIPSVVHLAIGHYAAVVRHEGGAYLIQDPTFGDDHWVSRAALASESSGYSLIPSAAFGPGWRDVTPDEGRSVWGKGMTTGNDDKPHGCNDPSTEDPCTRNKNCQGMAVPRVHLMLVSLNINDDPAGYSPPVGPPIRFTVRYNQRDAYQPATFSYSNLGPKWTFDWLSYIKDDPSHPVNPVEYYMMGGGTRSFTDFDTGTATYAPQQLDQTRLVRTSPDSYEMLSGDGVRKVFGKPDGSPAAATSRRVFLTQVVDPHGNAVTLTYDAALRLVTITDSVGQQTAMTYGSPADAYKITKITDPFGRSALFEYDASGRLAAVTDVIGITSRFSYDHPDSDFINTLTTPYGTTTFTKNAVDGNTRSLETLYPDGTRDRVEYNQSLLPFDSDPVAPVGMSCTNLVLSYRNTFYWNRKAFTATPDYRRAKIYHWLHMPDMTKTSGILESVKEPLENRIWYDYAGQSSSVTVGSTDRPAHIGRVLADGSSQIYTYEYNDAGNITRTVDPLGRTFSYVYADNGIDLLETRQTRGNNDQLLARATFDSAHLPLTSQDAAGQVAVYTYNARGQVQTQTNPKNEVIRYSYDDASRLTLVEGPLPGYVEAFAYDSVGRVRTRTDESGHMLTFDHDDLDRLVRVTHPDATFEEYAYTWLDHTSVRDRAGRRTSIEYDSVRQMTSRTDPLGRVTRFAWCACGALRSIADPMGRITSWQHDAQGRLVGKRYADGSQISYLYEKSSGWLSQRTDERLQVTQYDYNIDGTLAQISYANAAVETARVAFTYDDDFLRLTSMTDRLGVTHYSYFPITPVPTLGAGLLAGLTGPIQHDRTTFDYDELGRCVSRVVNGDTSSETFDAGGRRTSVANSLGTFTTTYEGASLRQSSSSHPNGLAVSFSYADNLADQALTAITNTFEATPVSQFTYAREVAAAGRILSWSQQQDSQPPSVQTLNYDAADQLTGVSLSAAGAVPSSRAYRYDPAGNRVEEQADASVRPFAYNTLNQLAAVESGHEAAVTYQWDAEQRLASVDADGVTTELTYDGLGRCVGIRRTEAGTVTSDRRFLWSGTQIHAERTPAGVTVKRFFDQGFQTVSAITADFFYSRDHLGSIREVIDGEGTVRCRYAYDPFGRRSRVSGDIEADYGFAGMFSLSPLLSLTLFRVFDADLGRWLSRDPVPDAEFQQGPNLYAYVGDDPVNRVDPFGLACEKERITLEHSLIDVEHQTYYAYLAAIAAVAVFGLTAYYTKGKSLEWLRDPRVVAGAGLVLMAALTKLFADIDKLQNIAARDRRLLAVCMSQGPGSGAAPAQPSSPVSPPGGCAHP